MMVDPRAESSNTAPADPLLTSAPFLATALRRTSFIVIGPSLVTLTLNRTSSPVLTDSPSFSMLMIANLT